jgi:signal transduction histidine kinase
MKTNHDEYLKYSTIFITALGVILLYGGIWSLDTGLRSEILLTSSMQPALWITCGLFFAGAFLSNYWSQKSYLISSWVLCLFATIGTFVFLSTVQTPFGVLVLLLPVFLAAFLLNWKHILLLISLILIGAVYLNFFRPMPSSNSIDQWLSIFLMLFVSGFLALITGQLNANLAWFEHHYVSVHKSEQIIRDDEAELKRLLSHMKDYQKYLRETNELLIVTSDEAEKARQVKQIFVQNVSHELRTPLNLIIGFSETMMNAPENYGEMNWTEELKGDIECIYQNSQHLKDLIDDVLDLATLENKKYDIQPQKLDVNSIIKEVVLINEDAYKSKALTLETTTETDMLLVQADPVRIKQVLFNLLSNALKYTLEGGVEIISCINGSMAKIDVKDNGKGIPKEDLEKVFEVFYQVDKASNREDSGTGLGLSISKQLVELHGGEMSIKSVVGQGTTVSFTLPLAEVGR